MSLCVLRWMKYGSREQVGDRILNLTGAGVTAGLLKRDRRLLRGLLQVVGSVSAVVNEINAAAGGLAFV